MSILDDAILLDETGQDAVTELTGIKNALTRNATDIPFSPTASGLSQTTVQGAINETARITSYAYDNTATYAKGRYCIYNGGLYKCTTAISTPEEWNVSHWTATTVEAELANTNSSLANKIVIESKSLTFVSSVAVLAKKTGYVLLQVYGIRPNTETTATYHIDGWIASSDGENYYVHSSYTNLNAGLSCRVIWLKTNE